MSSSSSSVLRNGMPLNSSFVNRNMVCTAHLPLHITRVDDSAVAPILVESERETWNDGHVENLPRQQEQEETSSSTSLTISSATIPRRRAQGMSRVNSRNAVDVSSAVGMTTEARSLFDRARINHRLFIETSAQPVTHTDFRPDSRQRTGGLRVVNHSSTDNGEHEHRSCDEMTLSNYQSSLSQLRSNDTTRCADTHVASSQASSDTVSKTSISCILRVVGRGVRRTAKKACTWSKSSYKATCLKFRPKHVVESKELGDDAGRRRRTIDSFETVDTGYMRTQLENRQQQEDLRRQRSRYDDESEPSSSCPCLSPMDLGPDFGGSLRQRTRTVLRRNSRRSNLRR